MDAYHNTAGEVESRNVERRSRMTAEEKRNSLLSETEDVAEESKIYLMDGESILSDFALFDNNDKSQKVMSALQKIADGSDEETIPGLRNNLSPYGGTNDLLGKQEKGYISYCLSTWC